ncbi:DNA-processing protein DprA [Bacillota bacterium]
MTKTDAAGSIKEIYPDDAEFPGLLKSIADPPSHLYCIGNKALMDSPCLAIVGSRKATPYGKWAAYNIAKLAAEHGVTIVSGMASGIDACAHLGALDAEGCTIAVLGCGPDICYPKTNRNLMDRISRLGLVISEYPPGTEPLAFRFPERNRIISGLSYATAVVEADLDSGSLITASKALEQGREVFAVPGNIDSIFSRGTNRLIQDGATPLTDIEDILELLNIRHCKTKKNEGIPLGEDEKKILKHLKNYGTLTHDRLCILTGKQPSEVGALITILEMKGAVRLSMGKIHVAK